MKDLDVVRLKSPVQDFDGQTVPAGQEGTIVWTHRDAVAFEVEFEAPFFVVTVEAEQLDLVQAFSSE